MAVTVAAALIVIEHVPVPVHPPDQPANVVSASGTAVSTTGVVARYVSEQSTPQSIPAGTELTVPVLLPAFTTVSGYVLSVKVAVTAVAAATVVVQGPVPVHPPPDQPVNDALAAGVAVRITDWPTLNAAPWVAQVVPQLRPVGFDTTVPVPLPALLTVSVYVTRLKRATTLAAALTVRLHSPVPLHEPVHPANTEFAPATAVSTIGVPARTVSVQSTPQSMPAGIEVTLPTPLLAGLNVTVTG